ncbi:MAG: citramalate synthase [Proteobacteria bacterium]|nr:citramalate synthase [Pseudomonadota bacterium]MBU4471397.1 citramalate synthase [Pseudomonadota bacterium]MCG2752402.1 citramalate synthase [Desulfobacteraceae bacterium]
MEPVVLYDTTLRDGTQGENINFTPEEKIKVAKRLDDIGIHYIEGGWPGSNPRDKRFFELVKAETFHHAIMASFGSTRKPGIRAKEDGNLKALVKSDTEVVTIVGKSWDLHVLDVMENTEEENLAMILESVEFLKERGRRVFYDAEHFFDAYKADRLFAMKTLLAAADGGAEILVLCDTNGGTLPFDIETIVKDVGKTLKTHQSRLPRKAKSKIGIHTHNDCGMAVANAMIAVNAGATMVQGTINGYGERCGNADLTSMIPILGIKMKRECMSSENLQKIRKLSRFVAETANMMPVNSRPFVGKSAFAHKGGIHVSAIMKNPAAYEHIDPELVGNKRRVLISDLSGKSNIEYKAKELGIDLTANGFNSRKIVTEIKRMEEDGYQFDVADGSFKIMMEKFTENFKPRFELDSFRVTVEKDKSRPCTSHAIVKITVENRQEMAAAEGHGPVSALDNALRKALSNFFPDLSDMGLVDFKVRVMDGQKGTSSKVRVFIESRDLDNIWTTVGVSEDIIEASWQALADSFHFKLSNS